MNQIASFKDAWECHLNFDKADANAMVGFADPT